MPDIVREVMESYGWDEARALVRPSAEEIGDLDRVLAWLWWLPDRRDVLIVTAVGLGLNLRAIGRIVRLHHATVRRRESASLMVITEALRSGKERRAKV